MTTILTTTPRKGRRREWDRIGTNLPDRAQALASAAQMTQRVTCEGCAYLQKWPRPQCKGEASAHFRRPRDTYHERCDVFAFSLPTPEPKPEPPPMSRYALAGEVRTGRKGRVGT